MVLTNGKRYRARIHLGFFEGVASNSTIADKLRDAGFADVVVSGSGRDRAAEGRWMGPSQYVKLPDQIAEVHEIY